MKNNTNLNEMTKIAINNNIEGEKEMTTTTNTNKYNGVSRSEWFRQRNEAISYEQYLANEKKLARIRMFEERRLNNAYRQQLKAIRHNKFKMYAKLFKELDKLDGVDFYGFNKYLLNNSIYSDKLSIRQITHDVPLYNRGDRAIRNLIEARIVESEAKTVSTEEGNRVMDKLSTMVEERVEELVNGLNQFPIADVDKDIKWRAGKVQSFKTFKFFLSDATVMPSNEYQLQFNIDDAKLISLSESNLTLKLSDGSFLSDVFIVRVKHDEDDDLLSRYAKSLIKDGVMINDTLFVPLLITPSQKRSGHLYICPASKVAQYRQILCNGVDFEGLVMDIDKLENRIALGASNGTILCNRDNNGNPTQILDWEVKYIDDVEYDVDIKLFQPDEKPIKDSQGHITYEVQGIKKLVKENLTDEYNKVKEEMEDKIHEFYINNEMEMCEELQEKLEKVTKEYKDNMKRFTKEVTDGFGLIDVRVAAHWATILGCINKAEYKYFTENFVSLNKMDMNDARVNEIFNKIPTAYQIRHHFDKGLLVIWDLVSEGEETPIVMTMGMHKRDEEAVNDAAWRVCNYNKKKAHFTSLTIQAIQALGLDAELLQELCDDTVKFLKRAMDSVEGAIDFLNLKDEDNSQDSLQSKLLEVLKANPNAFMDEWVQDKLFTLIEKQLYDMARGKFITTGAYYYMITDPRSIFGRETLQSGENYLNGLNREVTAVRYPCVNFTEPQKLSLVECEELWFLKDILVFNPHDGRWCGMGGADFDGDIAQVIFDERIIERTISYEFITDIVTHAVKFKDLPKEEQIENYTNNQANRAKMYLKCYNGSEVGLLSDNSSKYVSLCYHTSPQGFDNNAKMKIALMWTFIIGKEIDRAKTGESFLPAPIMLKVIKDYQPDWMVGSKLAKKKLYNTSIENVTKESRGTITKSNCPMGKVFRYMVTKYGLFSSKRTEVKEKLFAMTNSNGKAFLEMLETRVPLTNQAEIFPDMQYIYDDYKAAMSNLYTKHGEKDCGDSTAIEERNADYNYVFNAFEDRFESVCNQRGYNKHLAAYLLCLAPYRQDKINKGKTIDANHEIAYSKTKKSCVWNVAYRYMLDLLRTTHTNNIYVQIPDTLNGVEIVVNNGVAVINGVNYKCDKVIDGSYTSINNSNGSFISVKRNQLVSSAVSVKEQIDIYNKNALATTTLEQFKKEASNTIRKDLQVNFQLCSTSSFCLKTPMNVLHNMKGREFTVVTTELNGEVYPAMSVNIKGKDIIVSGLYRPAMSLLGQKFYVEENVMSMCEFYATKGKRRYDDEHFVREMVNFVAIRIGVDETVDTDITELAIYDRDYVIEEEVENNETHNTSNDYVEDNGYDVEEDYEYDEDCGEVVEYDEDEDFDELEESLSNADYTYDDYEIEEDLY